MLSLALLRLDSMRDRAAGRARPDARGARRGGGGPARGDDRHALDRGRAARARARVPGRPRDRGARRERPRAAQRHAGRPVDRRRACPSAVSLPVKIALFRALQEGLSNATRHGGGAGIGVRSTATARRGDRLALEVSDDGAGFDPTELETSEGLGLAGHPRAGRAAGRRLQRSTRRPGPGRACSSGGRCPRSGRDRVTDTIRVGVADDHPMFRAGVVSALRDVADIEVVGRGERRAEAHRARGRASCPTSWCWTSRCPAAAWSRRDGSGDACPATRIVMLTVSEDEDDILAAVKAGAAALRAQGRRRVRSSSTSSGRSMPARSTSPRRSPGGCSARCPPRGPLPIDELTAREKEVLELVAEGLSNQEIGERLGLAEKTDQALHDEHPGQAPRAQPCRGRPARRARRHAAHRRALSRTATRACSTGRVTKILPEDRAGSCTSRRRSGAPSTDRPLSCQRRCR